jgi:N-acetylmuramoyl-L-alanine amidase
MKFVISSGHGLHIRGASGYLDEVDEARKVVEQVATVLRGEGSTVTTFHDDVSTTQSQNLDRIVDYHNAQPPHDWDVSVHFNAYQTTPNPMGTEVLYVSGTGEGMARAIVNKIASVGFINRGPKKRTDLAFLNGTNEPAVLIETCFVDSKADHDLYKREFMATCHAIAEGLAGHAIETGSEPEPPEQPVTPPATEVATVTITIDPPGSARIVVVGGNEVAMADK